MKEAIIKTYINNLSVEDVNNFALKNDIQLSQDELTYIFKIIKNNWKTLIFDNPNSIFNELKLKLSPNKFNKLYQLYQTYYNKYSHYL